MNPAYWVLEQLYICSWCAVIVHFRYVELKGPPYWPCFDLVGGVVIDDLHGIYLGVTLTHLHLWFDKTNQGKPCFIGNQVI